MNKAMKVRQIYHELRRAVGDKASSREVLKYAHSLVELFSTDVVGPRFDLRIGGLPFENWALDVAYADGGWRVLSYEMDLGTDFGEEEWEDECPLMPAEEIRMENYL